MEENLDDIIASLIDIEDPVTAPGSADAAGRDEAGDRGDAAPPTDVAVRLTPRAAREVGRIRAGESLSNTLRLRVAVEGGGCSGLSYKLGFDEPTPQDLRCESQGIEIVVDPRHALYLEGCEIDYPDGLDARGFVFNNPNASESCGCGSSFAV